MQCLHRFCRECIQKYIRLGKRECPACRIHVPSRRSTRCAHSGKPGLHLKCCSHALYCFCALRLVVPRPDPTFDRLIAKVYPNLEAFEAQEEAEIQQSNLQHNFHNAFTESSRKAAEQQKINRLVCGTHHTFAVACT